MASCSNEHDTRDQGNAEELARIIKAVDRLSITPSKHSGKVKGNRSIEQPISTDGFQNFNSSFHCVGCDRHAFNNSELYSVFWNNLVVKDFKLSVKCRIRDHLYKGEIFELKKLKLPYKEWIKESKISCAFCGHDWGIICICNHLKYPFVKIENFRVYDINGVPNFYDKWNNVPFTRNRNHFKPFNQDFQDVYNVCETVTEDGKTIQKNGIKLEIPAGALPVGGPVQLLGDTTTCFIYLHENVEANEQKITPSVVFEKMEDCDHLLKHAILKIKHNAKCLDNVKVYQAEHRQCDDFEEIERKNDNDEEDDNDESFYTIDETQISIHTKSLTGFVCTEADYVLNMPRDIEVYVYKHKRAKGIVTIEVYVFDVLEVHPVYLQRFKDIMASTKFTLVSKKSLHISKSTYKDDLLETTLRITSGNVYCDKLIAVSAYRRFERLFGIDIKELVSARGISLPQKLDTYFIKQRQQANRQSTLIANLDVLFISEGCTDERIGSLDIEVEC